MGINYVEVKVLLAKKAGISEKMRDHAYLGYQFMMGALSAEWSEAAKLQRPLLDGGLVANL